MASQIVAGAYDNARTADKMLARAKEHVQLVETSLEQIAQVVANEAADIRAEFEAARQRRLWMAGAMVLVILGVVVPLTWINMRSILRPIGQARDLANAIARGDLTAHIVVEGSDEASDLMGALAQMQHRLTGLVQDVSRTANAIRNTGGELSAGSQNLAQRSEQAATHLQETASTMAQVTGSVRQSAE